VTTSHPNQRDPSTLPVELRRPTVPPQVRDWVARSTGSAVIRVRRLAGASSTAVHRVDLADGGRFVLRRYVWPGFLEDEPVAPQRELEALQFAVRHQVAAPEVVAADVDGSAVGDGIPVLLMTLLPGRAVAVPDLTRLAEVAATIHEVSADDFGHDYFPWFEGTMSAPPRTTSRPKLWLRAQEIWHDQIPAYQASFIHRDFHPGNVLWSRGHATGVVDWANACRGPWGCDIAHCRTNLIDLDSAATADRFLAAYESLTGRTYDPYWEIAAVLEQSPSGPDRAGLPVDELRLERAVSAVTP
jgi:Ser/Thr protein kinase RdoA (MazF antagonist)